MLMCTYYVSVDYFQGFGDILNLVPLAENVIKLSAVCMTCNADGHFTKRTTKDQSVS
jgi:thymidine kinase